jgi:hypothetical protein
MMRPIAIGVSDFKYLIEKRALYVDKTLFIKEIMDDLSQVLLFTRPRRFGKTLNLSMVKYFFENSVDTPTSLFDNLLISKQSPKYLAQKNQFPVIWLSFKDLKESNWTATENALYLLMQQVYLSFKAILPRLEPEDQSFFTRILQKSANITEIRYSLAQLTKFLFQAFQKKVWILIDEYDVPVQTGFISGYYTQIIEFMRVFFGSALKDNIYLEKALLTGIIRITKESIFSGLNNIKVCSVLMDQYSSYFGLLEPEVDKLLEEYELTPTKPQVQQWYDGYHFGNNSGIYNPWSITNFLQQKKIQSYWINTSENELIKDILTKSPNTVKIELQTLIQGGGCAHAIEENIVFQDLNYNPVTIWSLFLACGYLKAKALNAHEFFLEIPNEEIRSEYERIILAWFINKKGVQLSQILKYLVQGESEKFAMSFQEIILESFSVFDIGKSTAENFYHAFVLGMIIALKDQYEITSNRESGLGRYDICLIPVQPNQPVIIIEFKVHDSAKNKDMEKTALAALAQIDQKQYASIVKAKNLHKCTIMAIVFEGKQVLIKSKLINV